MEYLGFWVTRTGILPINKKVEAIVNMTPPKNTKHVRFHRPNKLLQRYVGKTARSITPFNGAYIT